VVDFTSYAWRRGDLREKETPSGPPVREKVHSRSRGGAAARRGGRTTLLRIIQVAPCCHYHFTTSLPRWFAQTITDSISWGEKRPGEATADGTNSRYLPPPYKDFVYAAMADYIIATIVPCQYPLLTLPRRCPNSCGFGQVSNTHRVPTPCLDLPPTRRGTTCESGPAPEETR
jgi:hypothetical protein